MNHLTSTIPTNAFVFDEIPRRKFGLVPLIVRYLIKGIGRPVAVMTEGLEQTSFHRRVAFLVDRNTSSANEMLLAFARERHLAVIIGEPTPGRVLSGNKFKLPYGYIVALPVAGYQTTQGNTIEGSPIGPDVVVVFDPEAARDGRDPQLEAALDAVRQL
jgi:C-terminal processing protease CtpA/Prc